MCLILTFIIYIEKKVAIPTFLSANAVEDSLKQNGIDEFVYLFIHLIEESTNETENGVEDNSTETDDGADDSNQDNDSKENDTDDNSQESDNDTKDSAAEDDQVKLRIIQRNSNFIFSPLFVPF